MIHPQDNLQCAQCGHLGKEHIRSVPKKRVIGYRQVRGKHRFGGCSHAHGIPGLFCTCDQFQPTTEAVNVSVHEAHMLRWMKEWNSRQKS